MSLGELFASITDRRRRSAQQSYQEGAQIKRRLQELLAVPSPTQEIEIPFSHAVLKTTQHPFLSEARLNLDFSEPYIGETRADFD
jgi:hypothetical protein